MNFNINDIYTLPTPCYLIDYLKLIDNAKLLKQRSDILGIKPLLSIKGFPLPDLFFALSTYFEGISASGLYEAILGETMKKDIHIHSPAYKNHEIEDILSKCKYIIFNSISQLNQYKQFATEKNQIGLRINPEYSEVTADIYNPCLKYSRFGVTKAKLNNNILKDVDGFHIHAMCEQDAESFARLINKVNTKFSDYFNDISWVNFGGGQQITSPNYNIDCLVQPLNILKSKYNLNIYIEPCESVVSNCGYFIATVLDIVENQKLTAILDASATCHMPSVLEMPYTPDVIYPTNSINGRYSYILSGCSCLAGDIIGEYFFDNPLKIGDKIIFAEMAAYSFCRANYFNGINLPDILLYNENSEFRIIKHFTYRDYISTYTSFHCK